MSDIISLKNISNMRVVQNGRVKAFHIIGHYTS